MARKPLLDEDSLYEIATYLSRSATRTEIHAELLAHQQDEFEKEYAQATSGYPLPLLSAQNREPYYVWPEGTNKQGRELRIYFLRVSPEPPLIRDLYTDRGKWKDKYRINHSNLVMQLFECGFVLGDNSGNQDRIDEFMRQRFPVVTDDD